MTITPAADQHAWDPTSHSVWDDVPVASIQAGDVISQTLQVDGIGRQSEHKGRPAIRFDVHDVSTDKRGRLVLQEGSVLGDVKRYHPDRPVDPIVVMRELGLTNEQIEALSDQFFAVPANIAAVVAQQPVGAATADDRAMLAFAAQWIRRTDPQGAYETDEQRLFSMLCDGVRAYSRMSLEGFDRDALELPATDHARLAALVVLRRECKMTLESIAENVVDEV